MLEQGPQRYWAARLGLALEHRFFTESMATNLSSRAAMAAVGLIHARTFHLRFDEPVPGSRFSVARG